MSEPSQHGRAPRTVADPQTWGNRRGAVWARGDVLGRARWGIPSPPSWEFGEFSRGATWKPASCLCQGGNRRQTSCQNPAAGGTAPWLSQRCPRVRALPSKMYLPLSTPICAPSGGCGAKQQPGRARQQCAHGQDPRPHQSCPPNRAGGMLSSPRVREDAQPRGTRGLLHPHSISRPLPAWRGTDGDKPGSSTCSPHCWGAQWVLHFWPPPGSSPGSLGCSSSHLGLGTAELGHRDVQTHHCLALPKGL